MTTDVKTSVLETLSAHVPEKQTLEALHESQKLDQLALDSLDMIEAVFELEEQFNIVLESHELSTIESIGDLITAIEQQLRSMSVAEFEEA
ncbi:MAG: phosphopantetheine-binding protein [Gammaproteobacteria bacterium]